MALACALAAFAIRVLAGVVDDGLYAVTGIPGIVGFATVGGLLGGAVAVAFLYYTVSHLVFWGSRVRDGLVVSARLGQRKDVREFIRRLEAVGLTVESTPGHYRVLRDGKPLRKANGMPFMLPFSPDTVRWRRAAIVELRKLGIDVEH